MHTSIYICRGGTAATGPWGTRRPGTSLGAAAAGGMPRRATRIVTTCTSPRGTGVGARRNRHQNAPGKRDRTKGCVVAPSSVWRVLSTIMLPTSLSFIASRFCSVYVLVYTGLYGSQWIYTSIHLPPGVCNNYIYVWSSHIARVRINRARLPILLVVS